MENIFKINVAEPYKLLDKVSDEKNLYPFLSSSDLVNMIVSCPLSLIKLWR